MSGPIQIQQLDPQLSVTETLKKFCDESFLILLDSAAQIRPRDARYSILTADPVQILRLDRAEYGIDPFGELRRWQQCIPQSDDTVVPFCGGIAGLMSYELGRAFERIPVPDKDDMQTPALLAGLFDWAIVWDHVESTVALYLMNLDTPSSHAAGSQTAKRAEWVMRKLSSDPPPPDSSTCDSTPAPVELLSSGHALPGEPDVRSSFRRDDYVAAVERVIEYIRSGDIFQANLSQPLTARWNGSPIDLYLRVRQQNPAPFCGLLQAEDFAVISASPERFLKVSGGRHVETRPIKGTRRRLRSPIADLLTGDELAASEKDRAENVMIVDLLRNDISRVCQPGTVRVTGLCEIEVFETVQHLVSTVIGELRTESDVWDLCSATIPGGSITGAPKIRAMEIIAELEPVERGAYCGNLFYLGPNGNFDSSILIRTFTQTGEVVRFPVGGGIVADSIPHDEYAETLHKAAGMLNTLRSRA